MNKKTSEDFDVVSIAKAVSCSKFKCVEEAVHSSLKNIGGLGSIVRENDRVLLKLNLAVGSSEGVTDLRVVEAVVKEILNLKAVPILADGSSKSVDYDTLSIVKTTGLNKIISKYNLDFVDLDNSETVWLKVPNGKAFKKMLVPKPFLEADRIINMPKLKTHHLTGITCSIKNLQGVVPSYYKLMTHALGLHQPLADLPKIFKTDLTIIDGIFGMEGIGPFYGSKVEVGVIISSRSIIAADCAACQIMRVDYRDIKHIRFCMTDFDFDPTNIKYVGEEIKALSKEFDIPHPSSKYLFAHRTIIFLDRFFFAKIFSRRSMFPTISRLTGAHLKINKKFDQSLIDKTVCPVGAIKKKKGRHYIDHKICIDCLKCQRALPKGSIQLSGKIISWKKN